MAAKKEQQFKDPINAYKNALQEHGDVIAVKKKDKVYETGDLLHRSRH